MRRLYVLRPEPGASATVERAKAMGLEAVAMPLFAIEAVPWAVPDARDFDGLLLTSANAVREAGDGLAPLRSLPAHAVGDATAAAAREGGFKVVTVGQAGVDALLEIAAPGMRLLHLCGEDRRAPSNVRHAVTSICVYRSRALAAPAIEALRGQVAAVHSPRSAERLAELAGQSLRATVRLVSISDAAAQAAGSGWADIGVAARPDDRELLALAARLCQKPEPK